MTEGNLASARADTRPDAIALSFTHADLSAATARLGTLLRFAMAEQSHLLSHKGLGRDIALGRWRHANTLLSEAFAELEQAQARLDAASRHVLQAVGDADDQEDRRIANPT